MLHHLSASFLLRLHAFERRLCIGALAILALVLFADVLMRSLLGNGLAWSHQSGVYANMVVSLMGLGLASSDGSHLRPRFADHLLPESWEPVVQRLQPLVTAAVFFLFAMLSLQLVLESVHLQERSTVLQTLVWPVQSLLPLVFFIASVRYLIFSIYPSLSPYQQTDKRGEVAE